MFYEICTLQNFNILLIVAKSMAKTNFLFYMYSSLVCNQSTWLKSLSWYSLVTIYVLPNVSISIHLFLFCHARRWVVRYYTLHITEGEGFSGGTEKSDTDCSVKTHARDDDATPSPALLFLHGKDFLPFCKIYMHSISFSFLHCKNSYWVKFQCV